MVKVPQRGDVQWSRVYFVRVLVQPRVQFLPFWSGHGNGHVLAYIFREWPCF